MKKSLWIFLFLASSLLAKVDYTEMSTEELLAMMGYVAPQNQKSLQKELQSREAKMTPKERAIYKENLKKTKK